MLFAVRLTQDDQQIATGKGRESRWGWRSFVRHGPRPISVFFFSFFFFFSSSFSFLAFSRSGEWANKKKTTKQRSIPDLLFRRNCAEMFLCGQKENTRNDSSGERMQRCSAFPLPSLNQLWQCFSFSLESKFVERGGGGIKIKERQREERELQWVLDDVGNGTDSRRSPWGASFTSANFPLSLSSVALGDRLKRCQGEVGGASCVWRRDALPHEKNLRSVLLYFRAQKHTHILLRWFVL